MKKLTLKADGQEITVYAEESELAKLAKPERARTGYERVAMGEGYYSHGTTVNPLKLDYGDNGREVRSFARGDYVNDRKLYDDRDRAWVLHNRLERWQAMNDEPAEWSGENGNPKFKIRCEYGESVDIFVEGECYFRDEGTVYFSTKEKAYEAIEVFRDELIWYYTKYRSRLDAPIHSNQT